MAKRSTNKLTDKLETQVKPSQKVSVRSCRNVKYVYRSPFSDKTYVFDRAGSQHDVSREEANDLLSKSRKGCGCGSTAQDNRIFEEVI